MTKNKDDPLSHGCLLPLVSDWLGLPQVNVTPTHHRAVPDSGQKCLAPCLVLLFRDSLQEIEVIPADDRILDKPSAALSNLLLNLLSIEEVLVVTKGDRP